MNEWGELSYSGNYLCRTPPEDKGIWTGMTTGGELTCSVSVCVPTVVEYIYCHHYEYYYVEEKDSSRRRRRSAPFAM